MHPGPGRSVPEAKKFYGVHFGKICDGEIASTTVAKTIAAYERTVTSFDSPYDRRLRRNDTVLSVAQKKGMVVFFGRGKCSQCHTPPHFTNSDFHNIGVPGAGYERAEQFPKNADIYKKIAPNANPGRAEVPALRSSCSDVRVFKTPTLQNVAVSGPYMHNGRFDTREGALRQYEELARGGGRAGRR